MLVALGGLSTKDQFEGWRAQRSKAIDALEDLLAALRSDESSQDIVDSYLRWKHVGAGALQALAVELVPDQRAAWRTVRDALAGRIAERYGGILPPWALKVPYASRTHEQLFCILAEARGEAVGADRLRMIAADAVHAERRVRELRELGLDVTAQRSAGQDAYALASMKLDFGVVETIVVNNVRANRALDRAERERFEAMARAT